MIKALIFSTFILGQTSGVEPTITIPVAGPQIKYDSVIDPNVITDPQDAQIPSIIKMFTEAVKSKNYFLAAAILLTVLIWFTKKYVIPKITTSEEYKEYLPIITIFLSVVTGLTTWFYNRKLDFTEVMVASVSIGFTAIGGWEAFLKPLGKLYRMILEFLKNIWNKIFKTNTVEQTVVVEKKDV